MFSQNITRTLKGLLSTGHILDLTDTFDIFIAGFIGKGMTRHINRVYNYFIKGFLGTVALVFLFPIVCILASLICFLMALATPIWVPVTAVILHVFMMIAYDYDSPDTSANRYCIVLESLIWEILIQGMLQPLAAVFVAAIVCPLASISVCFSKFFNFFFF